MPAPSQLESSSTAVKELPTSRHGSRFSARLLVAAAVALAAIGMAFAGAGYFEPIPFPPLDYTVGTSVGRAFCWNLSRVAQHRSSQWLWIGGFGLAASAVLTTLGALVGPGKADGAAIRDRLSTNRNALLAIAGGLIGTLGWIMVGRADNATTLASHATMALTEFDDQVAYTTCIEQRARWLSGRLDHEWLFNMPAPSSSGGQRMPAAPSGRSGSELQGMSRE